MDLLLVRGCRPAGARLLVVREAATDADTP